jgi:hypothetical protein
MIRMSITALSLFAIPHAVRAQSATVKGVVITVDGKPVEGANVFILETLDGVVTGSRGNFTIPSTSAAVTIVARKIGFIPATLKLDSRATDSIIIHWQPFIGRECFRKSNRCSIQTT